MAIHPVHRRLALAAALTALAAAPACGAKTSTPAQSSTGSASASTPAASAPAAASTTAPGSATPPADSAPGVARWVDLKPGQCLAAPPPTDPAEVNVTTVECAKPHAAEVYLRVNIPVDAAVTGTANAQCETGLTQYAGVSSVGGHYSIGYLIDSDQDRTANNPYPSTLICLLQGAQGQPLTGSAHR